MFAFVVLEQDDTDGTITSVLAARDPVGIKPLYFGRLLSNNDSSSSYAFASELKALVGLVDPATVVAIPPGHYWTPETGLQCYYNPDWLRKVRKSSNSRLSTISREILSCSPFL
jgi:asparagine synthase (glutamine-hydrolysing)